MPREAKRWPDGKMVWVEYDEPALEPDQVRLRSEFSASKHGTEMAFARNKGKGRGRFDREMGLFRRDEATAVEAAPPPPKPGSTGNMTVGTVIEVGAKVAAIKVGDRVLVGGGFRETHIRSERGCHKIPKDFSVKSAVCLDPANFACGAVRDGNIRIGDTVAVIGVGAIGLMAVQLARLSGAALIVAVDLLPNRLRIAAKCGADLTLDPSKCDAGFEMRKATNWRGVDVVIDYTGHWAALQAALRGVAFGGNVVAGAFPGPMDAGLDLGAEAHQNRPNIVFSRSCSDPNRDHPRWNEDRIKATCLKLLLEGKLSGEEVVTPVVKFADILEAYPKIYTEPDTFVKLGVTY